jgi:phytoene dehydrogenase-like protein
MVYDIVIIGAGHNGLIAGAYLVKAGLKVVVLEREDMVGGAVKTRDFKVPGFKWDQFSTIHLLIFPNPLIKNKEIPLEEYGLEYIRLERPFGTPFPDGDSIILYKDLDRTLKNFERQSKDDAEGWRRMYELYMNIKDYFLPFLFSPMSKFEILSSFFKLYRKLRKENFLEFIRLNLLSSRDLADEYFSSEKAKAWIAAWGFHPDYAPEIPFGSTFSYMAAAMQQDSGGWIPKGGGGMLTQALARYIERNGGEVKTNSGVERIILNNGSVKGVKLENGDIIESKRIIASIEPKQLFLKMIGVENLPNGFVNKVKRFKYGAAGMKIDFALSEPIKWIAGEEMGKTHLIHIGPSVDYISKAYNEALRGFLPKEPFLITSQPHIYDETRAPKGKALFWILVRTVPYEIKGDSADIIKGDNWDNIKEAFTDRVIELINSYAPNFKDSIIDIEIQSPLDIERNNLNFVRGDMVSGSHHLHQNFIFRPFPSLKPHTTPFEGLYITGASTWPGGGINGASGRIVAGIVLKDIGISLKRIFK